MPKPTPPRAFYTTVVGVTRTNADGTSRQDILARCQAGERLVLVREPDNPADADAVKVCRENGEQLGYLNATQASEIGPRIDRGWVYVVRLNHATGGDGGRSYGANITVAFGRPGTDPAKVEAAEPPADQGRHTTVIHVGQAPTAPAPAKTSGSGVGCLVALAIPVVLILVYAISTYVTATAQPLGYTIAEEEALDTPAKSQAVYHLVVNGQPTRASLEDLLNRVYREAAARSSKYHGRVTHVAVFAYETEAHAKAGMAQWLGMISRIGASAQPKIEIRDDRITALTAPKEMRFALSEDQRKTVWKEMLLAARRATQEARAKHPDPPPMARSGDALAAQLRQDNYKRSLVKAADAAIGKRYKLSADQLVKISVEAHEKNWAIPKP